MTDDLKQTLLKWLAQNRDIFLYEEIPNGLHLTEIPTKKGMKIVYAEIQNWRIKENTEGLGDYVNLVLQDGKELILCHIGFAFSPFYSDESPMNRLPSVTCFQDFYRLRQHLEHLYRDENQRKETVQTLVNALAILAGAHLIGLEIGEEEKSIEPILEWLEKR